MSEDDNSNQSDMELTMHDGSDDPEEIEISDSMVSSTPQEGRKRKRKRKLITKSDREIKQKTKQTTNKFINPTKWTQMQITDFMSWKNRNNKKIEEDGIWGDHTKSKKGCRLIFNNINGLCPKYKYAKVHIIAMQMVHFEADYMGLAETNIDWKRGTYKVQINNLLSRYLDQVRLGTSSSTETFNSYYQPGGTCCITHNLWANKTKMDSDGTGMGRWTEATITGKQLRKVTIITAYSVCERSSNNRGTLTSYAQQWNIIKFSHPQESPNPKEQLWKDLTTRIGELKTLGHEIILMLDANDSTMKNNSRFTKFIMENNLIDVHVDRHGTDDEPHTGARGSTRIDYILATEKINEYVTACGIMPLHDICFCDHRPIFADFDFECFLGNDSHKLQKMNERIINGHDPRKIKIYLSELAKRLNNSELENKLAIMSAPDYEFTNISHETLEEVDQEFQTIRLECEKVCAMKVDSPWSPTFHRAYKNYTFWKLWLSQVKRNKKLETARERVATEDTESYINDIPNCNNIRKFINRKVNESRSNLELVRKYAVELRDEFLIEQAEMYAKAGIKDKAKALRQQRRKELRGRMYKKLEHIMKPGLKKGPLTCIIQTNNDGEEILVFDPETISRMIIERNELHFSQSEGTPFTLAPLLSLLGPYATSEFCDNILHGTADIDSLDIDDATKCLLKQLKRSSDTSDIKLEIRFTELIKAYQKWRESTTTSPSGLHIGHEKALLRFKKEQEESAEEDGTEPLYMRVFQIKATLLNLALRHNHSYQRWAYVVNAMIEKIPGYPKPEKLRVIHLLESDFNILIGILWGRRLLHAGEDLKVFDEGQGGSRPDHRTQELLVQKHLTYSIWRMAKQNGASFDNDAKSCFDRIVMTVASLCSQQIGMPKQACELFLNTLDQMKYHIKTGYGVSETSYSSDSIRKMHGPGQGGRGSPCIWLIISSALMKCMKAVNEGAHICDPFNTEGEFLQAITGFVDDITHWYSSCNPSDSGNEIVDKMQKTAQWWEQLLHSSGGKLELEKCFYYLVEWKFDEEGDAKMINQNLTKEITMDDTTMPPIAEERKITLIDSETKESYNIPRKSCDESHKTLGVLEVPNGDYKDEKNRLTKKSQGFAQRVSTTKLNCWEAKTLYFQMYLPSMTYSATIGTLSENAANTIQAGATKQCLTHMGYNRCLPNAVVYGPTQIGGIGLHHLFAEQGSAKAGFIIRMLRTDRPAGKIILRQLKWAQRCAGISKSILIDTNTKLPQLDQELWIKSLREFLQKSQVTIYIRDFVGCELQCINDRYIMDIVLSASFTKREKININKCRYWLHATTLSDITNANGTHISKDAFNLNNKAIIDSDGLWPTQPHCGKVTIRHWKKFILSLCVNDTLLLDTKLGEWTAQEIRRKVSNEAAISLSNKKAALKIENIWSNSNIQHNRRFSTTSWSFQSPLSYNIQSWIPASVKKVRDSIVRLQWRKTLFSDNLRVSQNEWGDYINDINEWERSIIRYTKLQVTEERLKELLESDTTITIVSKGLYTDNNGIYAWVLDHGDSPVAHSQGRAFGNPMTTQRAEGIGKLSWLTFLSHFMEFHKVNARCTIRSFCGNKVVISQTSSEIYEKPVASAMIANFDIINEIKIKQKELYTKNIRSHDTKQIKSQDTNGPLTSQVEFMEDLVDMLNKDISGNINNYEVAKNVHMASCRTYLCIDNEPISSNETMILRWRWSEFVLQDYYSKTWKIKQNDLKLINRAGIHIARKRITTGQYAFSIKQSIGWLSTGKKLKHYGNILTACPLCGWEEDEHHLLLCDHRRSKMIDFTKEFESYLDTLNTYPVIKIALLGGITRYLSLTNYNTEEGNEASDELIKNQTIVGWNKFFQGFIHCNFAIKQEEYYKNCGKQLLGDHWSGKVSAFWIDKTHTIWKERNECVHESENDSHREAEEIRIHVRRLYGLKNLLAERDQDIFDMPLERRLLQPSKILDIWLNSIGPIVDKCVELHSEEVIASNRRIEEFFSTQRIVNRIENTEDIRNLDSQQENELQDNEDEIQRNMIRSRQGDINENLNTSGSTFVVTQVDARE